MEATKVIAKKFGIHFLHPNGDSYCVGWWQIEKDGFSYWHNHLKEKTWFTDELSREFTDICLEYLEEVTL